VTTVLAHLAPHDTVSTPLDTALLSCVWGNVESGAWAVKKNGHSLHTLSFFPHTFARRLSLALSPSKPKKKKENKMVHAWDKLLHKQQQQQDTSLEGGAAPAGKPTIIPDYYSGSYASTSIPSSASSSGSNPSTSAQAYYGTTHYQPSKQTVEAMRGAMMTGGVDSVAGKFDNKYQAKQEFKDIASKKFFRPKCDVVEGQRVRKKKNKTVFFFFDRPFPLLL